jgi:uncharacterized FlaG/YvyC family protein
MDKNLCKRCKREFIKSNNNQKFCSKDCFINNRKLYQEEYSKKHRKEINKRMRIYTKKHRQKINEFIRNKIKTNINFKLACNLRHRVIKVIKGNYKSKSTIKLLGCTVEHLKQHLQKQFTKGMSWSNYGYYGWHIDHIQPCSSFDLSKPTEQIKCFNYKNLQPLWAKDNLKKHNKINDAKGKDENY